EELPVLAHAGERGIRTILSGWGGDEAATFNGRGYLAYLLRRGQLLRLAQIIQRHVGLRKPHKTLRFLFRYAIIPLLPDAFYDRFDPYYRSDQQPLYLHPAFASQFSQAVNSSAPFLREVSNPREMQVRLL